MSRLIQLNAACLLLLAAAGMLSLSGCAGYRLGPTNGESAGAKSVQFNPFANETLQPRLSEAVQHELRRRLQHDGTYRLATHNNADIVVSGTLVRYERFELSLAPNDVLTGRDYRVTLGAQVKAVERGTGRVLWDQLVLGNTLIRVGSDLTSAERQALPLLAENLADKVIALLADGTW